MSDEKAETAKATETPVAPADSLIKPGKDASVELTEDELAKVAGGIIFVGGKKSS
jgi:hypothetical protein